MTIPTIPSNTPSSPGTYAIALWIMVRDNLIKKQYSPNDAESIAFEIPAAVGDEIGGGNKALAFARELDAYLQQVATLYARFSEDFRVDRMREAVRSLFSA